MLHLLGTLHGGPPWLVAAGIWISCIFMATGSGPGHVLTDILQKGKEALQSASGFLQARKDRPPVLGSTSGPGER